VEDEASIVVDLGHWIIFVMSKQPKTVVKHTFQGGRFQDHGIDLDVLHDLLRYRDLLVEVAKELWRRNNPDHRRLPANFESSLALRFYEVQPNCATIPLVREYEFDPQVSYLLPEDELDDAVALVASTIEAARTNQPLPNRFPKDLLQKFSDYGRTLRDDEWIEHRAISGESLCRYDDVVRQRLTSFADSSYEDHVDVTGEVTMAKIKKPRMTIEASDGREIEAAFRPEDEDAITTALKQHRTARLRIIGRGQFSVSGVLQKVHTVTRTQLLPAGEIPFDRSSKPIWDQFVQILGTIPDDELAKLPTDGADNHDFYIYGARREP
jgi:hypothetical protein